MDLESLETIAILDAQRDYMDMNEEDDLNEKNAMRRGKQKCRNQTKVTHKLLKQLKRQNHVRDA
ncbi:hypothetical protein Bca4012_010556 [Brassica carinata]